MGKITVIPKGTQTKAFKITESDTIVNLHSNLFKVNDKHEFICKQGHPYAGGYVVWVAGMPPEYITKEVAKRHYDFVKEGW